MRADRLISILLWLQVRGQTSTSELSRRLEVSERTILRDMDALSTAGIPVASVRGRRGGWRLPDEYRTAPRWLSAMEVGALAVLSPAATLEALGIDDEARSAWLKLQAALPPPHRAQAAHVRERLHVDQGSWRPTAERFDWLVLLHHAVQAGRMLWMRYCRADGACHDRAVHPLGLVAKGSTWYLVASSEGVVRTYRVSRVEAASVLPEPAERPPGFDLAYFWEESKASLRERIPTIAVTLRVADAALPALRSRASWAHFENVQPSHVSGWMSVQMSFELEDDVVAAVLGLGGMCEIIAPEVLRQRVIAHLYQALGRYGAEPEAGHAHCRQREPELEGTDHAPHSDL